MVRVGDSQADGKRRDGTEQSNRQAEEDEDVPIDQLPYSMDWEESAKQALEEVPSPFRVAAVSGTEEYAKNHGHEKITKEVITDFRKELGM